jgi:hypothetical protein
LGSCTYGVYDGKYDAGTSASEKYDLVPDQERLIEFDGGRFSIHFPKGALTQPATIQIAALTSFASGGGGGGGGQTAPGLPVYAVSGTANLVAPVSVFYRADVPGGASPGSAFLGASTNRGGPFQPLIVGGTSGNVSFALTQQLNVLFGVVVGQPPAICQTTPSCLRQCCGGTAKTVTQNGSEGPTALCYDGNEAHQSATCMESACTEGRAIGNECQQPSQPRQISACGNCPVEQGCCISSGGGRQCGGADANCKGALLRCDDPSDCNNPGEVCCLERVGTDIRQANALCKQASDCANRDRLCRLGQPEDCANGDICSVPGQGCAFNVCSHDPIPGVCQ